MSSVSRIQVHRPGSSGPSLDVAVAVAIAQRHAAARGWPWVGPIGFATRQTYAHETAYEIWTRSDWWGDQVRIVVEARTGRILESSFVIACLHQHHEA